MNKLLVSAEGGVPAEQTQVSCHFFAGVCFILFMQPCFLEKKYANHTSLLIREP